MKKFVCILILSAVFALTGCENVSKPTPSDTMGGLGAPSSGFVDPSKAGYDELGGAGSGLAGRDGTSLNANDYRVKNLRKEDIVVSVLFNFDDYTVRADQREKLNQAAAILKADPTLKVVAVGRTDWFGTEEYNLHLSDRRANSVKAYLQNLGVDANRIEILAMGKIDATPNVDKNSQQAQEDRRVDVCKIRAAR